MFLIWGGAGVVAGEAKGALISFLREGLRELRSLSLVSAMRYLRGWVSSGGGGGGACCCCVGADYRCSSLFTGERSGDV